MTIHIRGHITETNALTRSHTGRNEVLLSCVRERIKTRDQQSPDHARRADPNIGPHPYQHDTGSADSQLCAAAVELACHSRWRHGCTIMDGVGTGAGARPTVALACAEALLQ